MFALPTRRELALALVSLAVLLLQITLTRLLSVLVWYHWAFFAVSIAMVGLGAPGIWLALERNASRWLPAALLGAGALLPGAVVCMLHTDPAWSAGARLLVIFACLVPGALALGTAVCLLLLDADGPLGRLYAFDLAGACVGAMLAIPLLGAIPAPALAASLGLLPLAAAGLVASRRTAWVAAAMAVVLGGALASGEPFRVRQTKSYVESGPTTPIFERWTPTARLTVLDSVFFRSDPNRPFAWGLGALAPPGEALDQYWLEQDGSAGTPIMRFDGDLTKLDFLLYDVTTAGYQVRPPRSVAIVGAGGGRDVLTAKLAGATTVRAIELNAGIVDALRGPFAAFSGGVYDLPGVETVVAEGRSALTRSTDRFDLLQISLIDSWAATAAGAYSLSENSLYTVEAFRLYLDRLTEGGVLSVSRWTFEAPRLLFLAEEALRQQGVADPLAHLAMVDAGSVTTLLVSREPLTEADRRRLDEMCAARGFVRQLPAADSDAARILAGGVAAFAGSGLRLDPPTDDRPYFFLVSSPFSPPDPQTSGSYGFKFNAQAGEALRMLMVALTVASAALFFSPFVLRSLRRGPQFWAASAYFATIGFAFMLLENAWLQRFVLYLGHPSRAATAVLGGLLLGAGLGAAAATRVDLALARRVGWVVPLGLLATNFALGGLFTETLGWGWAARLAVSEAALVPAGFLMGFCFPIGMALFAGESRPWLWAINGFAGVFASVVSLALTIEIGIAATARAGSALYGVAFALLLVGAARARG